MATPTPEEVQQYLASKRAKASGEATGALGKQIEVAEQLAVQRKEFAPPPAYAGAFGQPTAPYPAYSPSRLLPAPQTRRPTGPRTRTGNPAYDQAFATFKKLNPNVSDEDADIQVRKELVAAIERPETLPVDPESVVPKPGALERQITGGPRKLLTPAQKEYFRTLNRIEGAKLRDTKKQELLSETIDLSTVPSYAGVLRGEGKKYTQTQVQEELKKLEDAGAFDVRPDWVKSADPIRPADTGNLLAPIETKGGLMVESPTSYALRVATLPFSVAGAGAVTAAGSAIPRVSESMAAREAETGVGRFERIIREGAGISQIAGDVVAYDPEWSKAKDLEPIVRGLGLVGDVLVAPDLGLVTGAAKGIRAAAAAADAATAARLAGVATSKAGAVAKAGLKSAARGLATDILPIATPAIQKILPDAEDARLVLGGKIGKKLLETEDVVPVIRAIEGKTDIGAKALKAYDEVKQVTKQLDAVGARPISGTDYTKISKYLKPAIALEAEGDLAKAVRAALTERKTPDQLMKALQDANVLQDLTSKIRVLAAQDAGIRMIDDAISKSKVFGKGADNLIALTDRTLTTVQGEKAILDEFKKSPIYKLNTREVSKAPPGPGAVGAPIANRVSLTPEDVADVRASVRTNELSGLLSRSDGKRIMESVAEGNIAREDLRLLVNAEVDAIGRSLSGPQGQRLGFGETALTERRTLPSAKTVPELAVAEEIAQTKRMESLKSDAPFIFQQAKRKFISKPVDLAITAEEARYGQLAADRVGALDRVVADELKAIDTNPEVRKLYDLSPEASLDEKIVAIGRGRNSTHPNEFVRRGMDIQRNQNYADHFVDTLFYGRKEGGFWRTHVEPSFDYGKVLVSKSKTAQAAYDQLVNTIASKSPLEISRYLDDAELNARLTEIVDSIPDVQRRQQEGALFRVTMTPEIRQQLPFTVLLKNKADGIIEEIKLQAYNDKLFLSSTNSTSSIYKIRDDVPGQAWAADSKNLNELFYALLKEEGKTKFLSSTTWDASDLSARLQAYVNRLKQAEVEGVSPLIQQEVNSSKEALLAELNPVFSDLGVPVAERAGLFDALAKNWGVTGPDGAQFVRDGIGAELGNAYDLMKTNPIFKTRELEEWLQSVNQFKSGYVSVDQTAAPAVAQYITDQVLKSPRYDDALRELATLSQLADSGVGTSAKTAARTLRTIRQAFKAQNSLYYSLVLSINPRFHAENNLSAPFITAFSTGSNPLMTPNVIRNYKEAYNVARMGGTGKPVDPNAVVVIDKFGNPYTRQDLYDLGLRSGSIGRSQQAAELPQTAVEETMRRVGGAGDPLAQFSDNMHRYAAVIHALENGKTIDEALTIGRRSLFDYGNLTEVERKIARQYFVFYNFWRQSTVTFFQQLFTNPAPLIRRMRATAAITNFNVGDDEAQNLNFFGPDEAGKSRVVWSANRDVGNAGVVVMLPQSPYGNGLSLLGVALSDPAAAAVGYQQLGPSELGGTEPAGREFARSVIGQKARPTLNWILSYIDTHSVAGKIPGRKNVIDPRMIALGDLIPGPYNPVTQWFNAIKEPAQPEEDAYVDGQGNRWVYRLSPADYANYALFYRLFVMQTGLERPLRDWTTTGLAIFGAQAGAPQVPTRGEILPYLGKIITKTKAPPPGTLEKKALEAQTFEERRKLLQPPKE